MTPTAKIFEIGKIQKHVQKYKDTNNIYYIVYILLSQEHHKLPLLD